MITQYCFSLKNENEPIPPHWAYRLYSWILEQLPTDTATCLHEDGEKPISQYICFDRKTEKYRWVINLLSAELAEYLAPALDELSVITLNTGVLSASLEQKKIIRFKDLMGQNTGKYAELNFTTTTGFRRNGNYVIFPDEKLILQSLVNKWNVCCESYPIADEDAFRLLVDGLHIVSYNLRSSKYPLKSVTIPGFYGAITMHSRLPAPLEDIWQMLFAFAPYAGIGIKTALGMGGITAGKPVYYGKCGKE